MHIPHRACENCYGLGQVFALHIYSSYPHVCGNTVKVMRPPYHAALAGVRRLLK